VTQLVLTFAGPDAPGITARLMRILAVQGARLDDIEQVVVQGWLTLGFAVTVAHEETALKELLFAARELGLSLEYRRASASAGKALRYALTVIARSLGPLELQSVSEVLAKHGANIERIHRLSEGGLACVELAISLADVSAEAALKHALLAAAGQGAFDCALQE